MTLLVGLEKKVAVLARLRECLVQGSHHASHKALEGVITMLPSILGSSQVIACQAALECVQPLVEVVSRESVPQVTKSLLHFILPALLDRLGDGRMAVRELALATLMSMWRELSGVQSAKPSSESNPSPSKPSGSKYSAIASSIPKFTTPFKSRILGKPRVSVSPSSPQWNPATTFERDIKARGFLHKIWRVREMLLEWLTACVEEYPDFPASHYLANAFSLLDDNQDAVRFASRRALNTIYRSRPEMQDNIVRRAQALVPHKPALLSAITAPEGELAAMPASPFASSRSGSRQAAGPGLRPGSRVAGARPGSRTARIPSRTDPAGPSVQFGRAAVSHAPGIPRPGSRAGQLHGPPQNGAQGPSPRASGGDPSRQPAPGSGYRSGYRSMSQQGYRPGSRTGFTGALSPGRISHQPSPLHSQLSTPSASGSSSRVAMSASPAAMPAASASTPTHAPAKPQLAARRSSNLLNAHKALQRQPSVARLSEPFIPSRATPSGVKVHNVPSRQSLASEFSRTVGFFGGRESEDNWIQRERAVGLYRGIVWGNSAIEFCDDLVSQFREGMHDVFKAVNSLRTSLSTATMLLCEDIATRLGPHASPLFDTMADVLLKQCAQTKKIAAQKAVRSLEVVYQHFPLRPKGVDLLRQRVSDKSPILRQAVVATCTAILRHHSHSLDPGDRRNADIFACISDIIRHSVADAQPAVREVSRELFWELHSASALHAKKLLAVFPEGTRTALSKDRAKYARDSSAQDIDRPMSAASIVRPPSGAHHGASRPRMSQGSSRESMIPSLMNVVAGYSPSASPLADRSNYSGGTTDAALLSRADPRAPGLGYRRQSDRMEDVAEAEEENGSGHDDDNGDDDDSIIFQATGGGCSSQPPTYSHAEAIKASAKSRMSLGLIDFSNMDIGSSLLEVDMPPRTSAAVSKPGTAGAAASVLEAAETTSANSAEESQATAVAADSMEVDATPIGNSQPACIADNKHGQQQQPAATKASGGFAKESEGTTPMDVDAVPAAVHFPTPDRTPLMSPSPPSETRQTSYASLQPLQHQHQNASQFATPRTQTARYWSGPIEPPLPPVFRQTAPAESPLPSETPQRLGKIEAHLSRLAANDNVDEALFRSLARFAKEESAGVWLSEDKGGSGYLERVLVACLGWLQSPAENRDTVFTKDSCFDVLRVLVRRKWQCFTLDTARPLLLEVLRNRFFESTILSGSAEDVFYDMAAHLDPDLCFALVEDFFQRAPLPPVQCLGTQKPGYAVCAEPMVRTAADLDPMSVFRMDNALAGVLELAAEVVKRLRSPDTITQQEMDRFMPYSIACFVHPRSQVRKAALGPIIAVHEKAGAPDAELEELLLRAGEDQLAASANPLAKYISQLSRPELRRLVWTFYLSKRDV
ncbi:hypothetical protein GQ54DRAFT_340849 [Martensiomyces pterosporus]|nr:hypothetical protein GQ54DRAFT_340849 [Martensiomyces pterosporus]